jgi:hypothetical protein
VLGTGGRGAWYFAPVFVVCLFLLHYSVGDWVDVHEHVGDAGHFSWLYLVLTYMVCVHLGEGVDWAGRILLLLVPLVGLIPWLVLSSSSCCGIARERFSSPPAKEFISAWRLWKIFE